MHDRIRLREQLVDKFGITDVADDSHSVPGEADEGRLTAGTGQLVSIVTV